MLFSFVPFVGVDLDDNEELEEERDDELENDGLLDLFDELH